MPFHKSYSASTGQKRSSRCCCFCFWEITWLTRNVIVVIHHWFFESHGDPSDLWDNLKLAAPTGPAWFLCKNTPEQTPVLQVLNRNTSVISSIVVVLFSLEHLLFPSRIQGLLSTTDLSREHPVEAFAASRVPVLFVFSFAWIVLRLSLSLYAKYTH